MFVPVRGVELLLEGDDVLVGPDPLPVGEPLQGGHPVVHLADQAGQEGLQGEGHSHTFAVVSTAFYILKTASFLTHNLCQNESEYASF